MNKKEYTPDGCFFFGKVTKTHGLKGEVTIKLDVANPLDFKNINYVMMDINGDIVPFFIESSKMVGDKMFVLFQDVKTMEQAVSFLGNAVYLPNEMLPELDDNDFYFKDIVGYKLVDETYGEVGFISDVLEYPTQAVIQVMKDGKEILIPIHDDIIRKVDKKSKVLNVKAPEGLIDMYLSV
ncbi:MAG: ribosome maturation factor RimM [Bacteroidales bacterium]|nr:ribosome maturation factor RimM [Bacteroidales bacterium]